MNKSYINQGMDILIFNENGEGKQEKNLNNIEHILRLENYKNLIQKELEISTQEYKILKTEKKIATGTQIVCGVTFLGMSLPMTQMVLNLKLDPIELIFDSVILEGIIAANLILVPFVWKYETKNNIKKTQSKIKKLELFDFATDKAMKINKAKSKAINKESKEIHYIENPSFKIINYYYNNYDSLKEQYCQHRFIKESNYDELDNSLLNFMMEKEIENESKIKTKNLTKTS